MARPHKQTVKYFPHDTDASDGKTLTIIQSKYGNTGYSFWFKLLQILGKASGHYYDFNNPSDWEFLLAKTHQNDTETTKSILEMLVALGAIDAELYAKGVIWCQKFVDGVADAYSRTVEGVPKRPDFLVNVGNQEVSVDNNPENPALSTQTKLKETKLNKKEKNTKVLNPIKRPYGEFNNVFLTDKEYQKLKDKFGEDKTKEWIETLSGGIERKGYKYLNHYAAILAWERREGKKSQPAPCGEDPDKYIKGKYGHIVRR